MGKKDADPWRIHKHGEDIANIVVPLIDRAGQTLSQDGAYNLEGGDFSIVCFTASAAYPMAVQFAFEDLKAQKRVAESYVERIGKSADNYAKADQQSNIGH
ncbi:hypothetical protein E1287_26310 [Actinomadura sp. KC06]|uniref:hypothetical protein n=1 Tax=Actinomadura sp. KC06 TaxID=2530369 RepID=UPI00104E1E1C|nr:hypothetical protein [Actinomadura sp. KC06]TDD31433.1 hypothetical protein E1287_26310 [Actinomadura sp. KC06]